MIKDVKEGMIAYIVTESFFGIEEVTKGIIHKVLDNGNIIVGYSMYEPYCDNYYKTYKNNREYLAYPLTKENKPIIKKFFMYLKNRAIKMMKELDNV